MKKRMVISMLFVMAGVLSVVAQDALSVIRKHYSEAQQKVSEFTKAEEEASTVFPEYYEVNVVQNLPGTGPHHERMRMYFFVEDNEDWQPDEPMLTRSLQFVTYKYNYAAREFYEEYLYDKKGNIEFAYIRDADMEDSNGGEFRLYFSNGKLFKVLVNTRNPETDEYVQTYSGATMPEKYSRSYEYYKYRIERNKRMFTEIDNDTFH